MTCRDAQVGSSAPRPELTQIIATGQRHNMAGLGEQLAEARAHCRRWGGEAMAAFMVPAYIEQSKIAGSPLHFEWGPNQFNFGHGFTTGGERSSIVRKLEEISFRGILGLLA